MKRKMIFLLTLLAPSIQGSALVDTTFNCFSTTFINASGIYLTCSCYEPNNNGYNITYKYRNEKTGWSDVTFYERNKTGKSYNGPCDSTFLEISKLSYENIITLTARFYTAGQSSYFVKGTREFKIYYNPNQVNHIGDSPDGEIVFKNRFEASKAGETEYKYNFAYKNFDSTIDSKNYREIDISKLEVKTSDNLGEIYLYINNKNKIFDEEIVDQNSGFVQIPLLLSNNHYEIKPEFSLYVDPISRHMSKNYKEGYLKTSHIYLPINTYNKTNSIDCKIYHSNVCGTGKDVEYNFSYAVKEEFYGSCYDSSYCLNINQDKNQSDLETIYEVVYD